MDYIFFLQLISDAGYQAEIGAMSSACNQIEVFSKVLKTSIIKYLTETDMQSIISDLLVSNLFGKMLTHFNCPYYVFA